jgi:L,D-transpeptidase catalytic domain
MTIPKFLALLALFLLLAVGIAAWMKKDKKEAKAVAIVASKSSPIEIDLEAEKPVQKREAQLPSANRVEEFFNKGEPKFPFVETITYRSRVPWQKGRPAWLSDYASHFATSRHFIARSLNGKTNYFKQDVAEGDRFNVLRPDKKIEFYLLIDISRCRLWFYVIDLDTKEATLVKDYLVGLGREEPKSASGLLTPLGKYTLGNKIAIYKPTMSGLYANQKVEMMTIFGSRWMPFDKEVAHTTAPAKGLGLHGVPWRRTDKGELVEERSSLGQYASDGCIRLATEDIEELFAIVITRPTTVELVRDFNEAVLPGK